MTSNMNTTLLIENNVNVEDLNVITDFFQKYNIGKPKTITHNAEENNAVLELEEWYNDICAKNMYERICEHGSARIVYNDPEYFTVRFYDDLNENIDYRDEYVAKENKVNDFEENVDYRDEYVAEENYLDNQYANNLNNEYSSEGEDYLEDDVIENTNNIDMLFDMVKEMSKKINNFERRIGNISKKTTLLYKNRPRTVKRSVWTGRLRSR